MRESNNVNLNEVNSSSVRVSENFLGCLFTENKTISVISGSLGLIVCLDKAYNGGLMLFDLILHSKVFQATVLSMVAEKGQPHPLSTHVKPPTVVLLTACGN